MRQKFGPRERLPHNNVAQSYNTKHTEIFNEIEQNRLQQTIYDILNMVCSSCPKVLDFGAGTGNLSLKFLEAGCFVTAIDVSSGSLNKLSLSVNANSMLQSLIFNGETLPFADCSFDICATYSVLHHIPNYLQSVSEMIRVVRPGGLVYIDHEASEEAWSPSEALKQYRASTRQTRLEHLNKLYRAGELFTWEFVKTAFIKAFINKRYKREGDIHVWPDDHIQWDQIKYIAKESGASVVKEKSYLLYRPKGGKFLFDQYKEKCNDTKYIIFKKNKC